MIVLALVCIAGNLGAQQRDDAWRPFHLRDAPTLTPAPVIEGDEFWDDRFGDETANAINGNVHALVVSGASLYAGGTFTTIGVVDAAHVARWDTATNVWESLGVGSANGVDGQVYALAIQGDDLYVGGRFTRAGGVAARNIARWNIPSRRWFALGEGVTASQNTAYVSALAIRGDEVVVGGGFTQAGGLVLSNVARWNSRTSSWSVLDSGTIRGVNGDAIALAWSNDTLFVGGRFTMAGEIAAHNIVGWTKGGWFAMAKTEGEVVQGYVNAITVGHGYVFVGGRFSMGVFEVGPDSARNLARWDQRHKIWRQMRSNIDRVSNNGVDDAVRAITIIDSTVYVAGTFTEATPGGQTAQSAGVAYIAAWKSLHFKNVDAQHLESNIGYSSLGASSANGLDAAVNALVANGSGVLYVGGNFRRAGGEPASHIAQWDGHRWSDMSGRVGGQIYAIAQQGSDIFAAGLFKAPGRVTATGMAWWDGTRWRVPDSSVNGKVYALAQVGDQIIAGGQFGTAGGSIAFNIARYTPATQQWSALKKASGVGGGPIPLVAALARHGDRVYVGGRFILADTTFANNLAVWNSVTGEWKEVGGGTSGIVRALAVADNGDLYVGGEFSGVGSVEARNIARWDGVSWSPLGAGVDGPVYALAVAGGRVYVGGDFHNAGEIAVRNIAVWDEAAHLWSSPDGGVHGGSFASVNAIAIRGSSVVVGGLFDSAGAVAAVNVARWNSDSRLWSPLGSGTSNSVRALHFDNTDGSLYVVGDFTKAGGKPSYFFGRWSGPLSRAVAGVTSHRETPALQLLVYPNPGADNVTFEGNYEAAGQMSLRIYSLAGQEVLRGGNATQPRQWWESLG